jgi:hypothetical protein
MAMIDQAVKVMNAVHKRMHSRLRRKSSSCSSASFEENPETFWQSGLQVQDSVWDKLNSSPHSTTATWFLRLIPTPHRMVSGS